MEREIFQLSDLYSKLSEEWSEEHWFRGQTQEYPGPLWPSQDRSCFSSVDCITITDDSRVRRTGHRFHLRTCFLDWTVFENEARYLEALKRSQIKLFIIQQIRNALGYALGEAFAQQVGLRSEGLDVTRDAKVALFFACFEWTGRGYTLKRKFDQPSVVYRWIVQQQNWSFEDLNRYDFYSCPNLVPVQDVLKCFSSHEPDVDSEGSIDDYRSAIRWGLEFDLDEIRGKRPYHLIRFRDADIANSRIERQHAGLLFPDVVPGTDFLRRHSVTSSQVAKEIGQGMFVEDLSQNATCEKFLLKADDIRKEEGILPRDPREIFPDHDFLFFVLRGWVKSLVQNPYGTLPVFFGEGVPSEVPWDELMQVLLSDDAESRYFV